MVKSFWKQKSLNKKKILFILIHGLNQSVNKLFTVALVTALDVMVELARTPATRWVRQLERPQEVVGLLKAGSHRGNLMDQVLHAHNVVLLQGLFHQGIVTQWDPLLVDLAVAALVDEFSDGLQVGLAIGHIGLDQLQHGQRRLAGTHKHGVVDLQKTQQLQDLAWFGCNVVDTADTDDQEEFGLCGNKVAAVGFGLAVQRHALARKRLVFTAVAG